ncbi:hypothetical protein GALMADRAFT_229828 [Galerina marginata CBS 339.88]|uniref:DUF6699 domain-containing protein n=1 Tax=Galerina marginata (strain CBS 339.88) TaxID=685588 RepID=A0A067SIR0_GALM3|nr:hypothetical protein GALMADRAFT_229828 [Galerina marginata CBS 339.88]
MGRPSYQHHACFYRTINPSDDLSKPWEASPFSDSNLPLSPLKPVFDIPKATKASRENSSSPSSPTGSVGVVAVVKFPVGERGLWARIKRFLKSGTFSLDEEIIIPTFEPPEPGPFLSTKVEPHEWKEYAYWSRPILNDVMVINSPVKSEKSVSASILRERLKNTLGPNDSPHPETWVIGTKHPALPPRPLRWKDPVPSEPLPFPWEVQLNPLLQHHLWGPSPLTWCLSHHPFASSTVSLGAAHSRPPCTGPDFAQPATWPFLTHMHFNAVAGDTAPTFPWPFTVENPRGIQFGDILIRIFEHFQKLVTDDERMSWPQLRQEAAWRAHHERCRMQEAFNQPMQVPWQDDMRRCDALGGVMWFRGIEPTLDGGGWMITFGTH